MTENQAGQVMTWLVGGFPSWLARLDKDDAKATMQLYVRTLKAMPFERTLEKIRLMCFGDGRTPEARPFAPSLGEIVAWCDIDTHEAKLALDRAIHEGGELHRDPYNRESIDGWVYVPKGVAPPTPQAQLSAPADPREYVKPVPTQNRMMLDRRAAAWRGRQPGAQRLGDVLPEMPPKPEPKEATG